MSTTSETTSRDAYDRALRDYTQLLRHRIANPLTAISAGLSTLRDVDLDDETRDAIFAVVIDEARRLEHVSLQPLALRPEEADLQPMVDSVRLQRGVAMSGDDLREAERARRAGRNEARFRTVNTQIVDASDESDELIEIACECSNLDCADGVLVTRAEYESIHANPACFIVANGHEELDIEHILAHNREWTTVEKIGAARCEAVRASDEDHIEHRRRNHEAA